MRDRQKKTVYFGVMAVVGILIISIVLFLNSKERHFKKYTDTQSGFSMKYPASWKVEENQLGTTVAFYSKQEGELDFFKENVNVVVQDLSPDLMDMQKYTDVILAQMESVFGNQINIVESKKTFFADQQSYKFVFEGTDPNLSLKYHIIWTIKGSKAYQLTFTSLVTTYEKYFPKFEAMSSSFKIL